MCAARLINYLITNHTFDINGACNVSIYADGNNYTTYLFMSLGGDNYLKYLLYLEPSLPRSCHSFHRSTEH